METSTLKHIPEMSADGIVEIVRLTKWADEQNLIQVEFSPIEGSDQLHMLCSADDGSTYIGELTATPQIFAILGKLLMRLVS